MVSNLLKKTLSNKISKHHFSLSLSNSFLIFLFVEQNLLYSHLTNLIIFNYAVHFKSLLLKLMTYCPVTSSEKNTVKCIRLWYEPRGCDLTLISSARGCDTKLINHIVISAQGVWFNFDIRQGCVIQRWYQPGAIICWIKLLYPHIQHDDVWSYLG